MRDVFALCLKSLQQHWRLRRPLCHSRDRFVQLWPAIVQSPEQPSHPFLAEKNGQTVARKASPRRPASPHSVAR